MKTISDQESIPFWICTLLTPLWLVQPNTETQLSGAFKKAASTESSSRAQT